MGGGKTGGHIVDCQNVGLVPKSVEVMATLKSLTKIACMRQWTARALIQCYIAKFNINFL